MLNVSLRKVERLFHEVFKSDLAARHVVDPDRVMNVARGRNMDSVSVAYLLGRSDAMNDMERNVMSALKGIDSSKRVATALEAIRDLDREEFGRCMRRYYERGESNGAH